MVIWLKIFKTEKTIEIQLVRLTEVCGKVPSEINAYKSVKTALLLSNVIDADHQNSCLFTNKGLFSSPLCVLIGVLAKLHESYFTNSSYWTLRIDFRYKFSLINFDPYAYYAACWFPLIILTIHQDLTVIFSPIKSSVENTSQLICITSKHFVWSSISKRADKHH